MRALWPINIRGQTEEARTIWSRENMAYTTSINDPAETLEKLIFAREQPHLFFFLLLLSQSFLLYRRVYCSVTVGAETVSHDGEKPELLPPVGPEQVGVQPHRAVWHKE